MYNKERIKELRTSSKISQQEMANILGITRSTYSMWESKNDIFPLKRLIDLCNYFDVSLDYIFSLTDTKQYKPNKKDVDLTTSGKRLKDFRKENNLTQVKLAQKLNIAPTILVEYEHGKYIISIHALYTICTKYHISADYLLGRVDKNYLKTD